MITWIKRTVWGIGVRFANRARHYHFLHPLIEDIHRLALRLISPPKEESSAVLPDGIRLRIPAGDPSTLTLQTGQYEPETTALLIRLLPAGSTYVDVGANIGYYTTAMSRHVMPGQVYAFEADPTIYRYLERNVLENTCSNVIINNIAVADKEGTATFVSDRSGWGRIGQGGSLTVQTTSLDTYFAAQGWPRITLMKVDVEGGEVSVLSGMKELVKRNPDLRLLIEYAPAHLERARESSERFFGALHAIGLTVGEVICGQDMPIVIEGPIVPAPLRSVRSVVNLLLRSR